MSQLINAEETVFYLLDKSIRLYRQMSQRRLNSEGLNITIDQWLILNTLKNNPEATQNEIAEAVFKDTASLTRIIDLLVKKKFLGRKTSGTDRRRFELKITTEGKDLLEKVEKVISINRKTAMKGLSEKEALLKELLNRICVNCTSTKTSL